MSITAYTGLPGAGKSYEVVNGPMLKASQAKRTVWTNIPTNLEGVHHADSTDEHWYLNAPPGALIVIDECWRYWPSGMKADAIPDDQKEFFAMHRHRTGDGYSTDIILVTQDLSQVAAFVRNLVEKTFRMRKLIALGTRTRYRVDIYDGAVTGQKPPAGRHIGGTIRKYNPEGFKHYQSHTQGGVGAEIMVDQRGSVWKNPLMWFIPLAPFALFLVPWAIKAAMTPDHEPTIETQSESEQDKPPPMALGVERSDPPTPTAAPPPPSPAPAQPEPPAPPPPSDSSKWSLLGVIWREDGTGFAIAESAIGRRRIELTGCDYSLRMQQWTCDLDGELVAFWTGGGSPKLAQAATFLAKESQ